MNNCLKSGKILFATLCLLAALALPASSSVQASDDIGAPRSADQLTAFPAAGNGQTRHVVFLPPQEDEFAFKVEIIVGKTELVDAHNRFFFGGALEEVEVEGWGYTRYVLKALGPLAGTMMAVSPDQPKVARFIPVGGGGLIVRYNSKLPLVVYVPNGVEVRYRVWTAGAPETAAQG